MKSKAIAMLLVIFSLGLTACDDGPAEDLGERIDDATTDAGNAIEDACEDVKDAAGADNKNC